MPSIEDIMAAILSPDAQVCPRCGRCYIKPGTPAADKYGVCEACYRHALASASEQYTEELRAERHHNNARKTKMREKRKAGITGRVTQEIKW